MKNQLPLLILGITIIACIPSVKGNKGSDEIRHVVISYEKGYFSGWPANFGAWSWGNDILVGFDKGYHKDLGTALLSHKRMLAPE